MKHTYLACSRVQVGQLCLGTMNFGPLTTEDASFCIMDRALEHGPISSIRQTCTDGNWAKGTPSRSSGSGFASARGSETRLSSRPRFTGKWANGAISPNSLPFTSAMPARPACLDSRPTISTATKCTTLTGARLGRNFGRRWSDCTRTAKFCTWAAALPGGTSHGRRRPPAADTFRSHVRTEPLQSGRPHRRLGGHPRLRGLRDGVGPVESLGWRAFGRGASKGRRAEEEVQEQLAKIRDWVAQ